MGIYTQSFNYRWIKLCTHTSDYACTHRITHTIWLRTHTFHYVHKHLAMYVHIYAHTDLTMHPRIWLRVHTSDYVHTHLITYAHIWLCTHRYYWKNYISIEYDLKYNYHSLRSTDLDSILLPEKISVLLWSMLWKCLFDTIVCIFWTNIPSYSMYMTKTFELFTSDILMLSQSNIKIQFETCHLCLLGITSCHSLYSKSADLSSWPLNALSVQISSLTLWLAELLSCTWVPSLRTPLILYSAALPSVSSITVACIEQFSRGLKTKQACTFNLILITIKRTDEANTCLRKENNINAESDH